MNIQRLNPEDLGAQALIAQSDAYMTALYPSESNHLESIESLKLPNVLFLGVFIENTLAGCGAVKILENDGKYGEIKRVFVAEEYRGKGLSKALMQALEKHLKEIGVKIARLETGIKQPEAIGLYAKSGYVLRSPFGSYKVDPLSIFMEKQLET
jgi:putative acetyltransferase